VCNHGGGITGTCGRQSSGGSATSVRSESGSPLRRPWAADASSPLWSNASTVNTWASDRPGTAPCLRSTDKRSRKTLDKLIDKYNLRERDGTGAVEKNTGAEEERDRKSSLVQNSNPNAVHNYIQVCTKRFKTTRQTFVVSVSVFFWAPFETSCQHDRQRCAFTTFGD